MTIWHWLVLLIVAGLLWGAFRTSRKANAPAEFILDKPKPIQLPGAGVGGWLALLVVGLVLLGPLRSVSQLTESLNATEAATPQLVGHPIWQTYKNWAWAIMLSSVALSIFTGARLAVSREASTVKYAILALWLCGPIAGLGLGVVLPFCAFGDYITMQDFLTDRELQAGLLVSGLITLIWTVYLANSKRVRDTYVLNPRH